MHADISLDSMCVPKLQVFIVLALENWYLLKGKLFEDFRYEQVFKDTKVAQQNLFPTSTPIFPVT